MVVGQSLEIGMSGGSVLWRVTEAHRHVIGGAPVLSQNHNMAGKLVMEVILIQTGVNATHLSVLVSDFVFYTYNPQHDIQQSDQNQIFVST